MKCPPLAFAAIAVALAAGCATVRSPSGPERAVYAAIGDAQGAFEARDSSRVQAAITRAALAAGDNVWLQDQVALLRAAWAVESGSLETARGILNDRLSAPRHFDQGFHDQMIFLCEAEHSPLCALFEAIQMMAAAEQLPSPWPVRMRLGNLWQRAHTLRAVAQGLDGQLRAQALFYAQQAREQFAALARETQTSLPSIAVLTEQFASLDGNCVEAQVAAHSLDPGTLDPQDLYTTAVALEACGDFAGGIALRQRILANRDFSFFASVYRLLARQAPHPPTPLAMKDLDLASGLESPGPPLH